MMPRLPLLLLVLTLTACETAAGTFISQKKLSTTGSSSFSYIAGGRDLATAVFGNPFGGDDGAFARGVAATFSARNTRETTNFTTTPGPSARSSYRLVAMFNPQPTLTGIGLCRAPETAILVATRRPITMQLALCNGDLDLASLRGRLAGADSADDPHFQGFLAQGLVLLQQPNLRRRP